jgi:hypothetical protein
MALLRHDTSGYCGSVSSTRRRASFDFAKFWKRAARRDAKRAVAAVTGLIAAFVSPTTGHATVLSTVTSDGYTFTNFDPTLTFGMGSNANGINNTGRVVGTLVDVNNVPTGANYTGTATNTSPLTAANGQTAFGINSAGDVVGGSGSSAFYLPNGGTLQTLTTPAGANNAFGINDLGNIVGQYTVGSDTSGFYLPSASSPSFTTIDQPAGAAPTAVNAQGVNNKGLIVGFYLGNDGQAHGFDANIANASGGTLVGTAIADPTIPNVPGEPGAIFVFSQVLSVNDEGIAVGYYGDSTLSQHGFLYNTTTGAYTFLDDPAEGFNSGVEATQITGISNSGEIAGFYTDANGIAHSFTAVPTVTSVPEPSTWLMTLAGFGCVGYCASRGRRRSIRSEAAQA